MKRSLLRYESKHQPVLPRREFAKRLAKNVLIAALLIGSSLVAGMIGYHSLEGLSWIDAFLNASMILSGMGPVTPVQTHGGKLFAGMYAIYSGMMVIVAASVFFAPVIHRMLHQFHADPEEGHGQ
jgi:hypothetical protein